MNTENKVKFCTECGSELKPGAKFCTNCGAQVANAAVNEETDIPSEEEKAVEEAAEVAEESEAVNEAEAQEAEAANEPEEEKGAAFGAAAGAAGAAGAAFGGAGNAGAGNGNGGFNSFNYGDGNYGNSYNTAKQEKYDPNIIDCFVLFFKNYFNFKGRTGRREYWLTLLAIIIPCFGISILSGILMAISDDLAIVGSALSSIYGLAILIPSIAICIRRLHDRNKSGAFYLFNFIPFVGSIILLVWYLMAGTPDENRFGDIERYEELAAKKGNMSLEERKKSKKVIFIVIGAIVIVVIAVIGVGLLVADDDSATYSEDTISYDDYDSDDTDAVAAPADFDPNSGASYVGTWKAIKAEAEGVTIDIDTFFEGGFTMELREDGSMAFYYEGEPTEGTWSFEDGHLVIDQLEDEECKNQYVDGMLNINFDGVILKFQKQ